MQNLKNIFLASISSLVLLGVGACGDDGTEAVDGGGSNDDADVSFTCDPVGANPEVGGLLNAPLDSDVEVIVKVPQHPGDPGPTDLP